MNIEQLEYIIEVEKCQTIAVASEKLHVSQSAISQAITNLEEELGVKIFHRTRNGSTPTIEGIGIIEKAREILNKLQELRSHAKPQANLIKGDIPLYTLRGVTHFLLPAIRSFNEFYPNIRILITEENSTQTIVQKLKRTNKGIGLIFYSALTPFQEFHFHLEVLRKGQIKCAANSLIPRQFHDVIMADELKRYPIVLYASEHSDRLTSDLSQRIGNIRIAFSSNSGEAILKAVLEGMAISFVPDFVLENDPSFMAGKIVALKIQDYEMAEFNMGLIHAQTLDSPDIIRCFVDCLKQAVNRNLGASHAS